MSVETEVKPKPVLREQLRDPKTYIGCAGLLVILFLCGRAGSWVVNRPPAPTPTPTETVVPSATATPAPTDTPEATAVPSPTPDLQGAGESVDRMLAERNTEAGVQFFGAWHIKRGGARFEVTVSDAWYLLATYQKERLIESVADQYALIAAGHGLLGDTQGAGDYPTTSFVSVSGKEVAYKSTFQTKVNE